MTILPPRENFSPKSSGAVALCARDFAYHSQWRDELLIVGNDANQGAPDIYYAGVPLKGKWYHSSSMAYVHHLKRIIAEKKPALIEVSNRPKIAWGLRKSAAKHGTAIALHLYNDPQGMEMLKTADERHRVACGLSAIYCVSEYILAQFTEGMSSAQLDEINDRLHMVYQGLPAPEQTQHIKENILLFAGRLAENKGGLLFAKALQIALPKMLDWRAVIVGADRHQPSKKLNAYERELAEVMESLGDRAECTGFVPHSEALRWFSRAEIAVAPTLYTEAFGRTALEALMHEAALITTGVGGLKEVAGDAALLLNDQTPAALAALMVQLAGDNALRDTLRAQGNLQAKKFLIEDCTKQLDIARMRAIDLRV